MHERTVDKLFLAIVITLIGTGFFLFISAALGVLYRKEGVFENVLVSQIALGLIGGSIAMYICARIKYVFWRKHAFWILLAAMTLSLLVFVPGVGFEHGGAKRWIDLRVITFQPSEFLKFGLVVYLAAWFSAFQKRIQSPLFGFYPLLALLAITAALLLKQPDAGTFLIACTAGVAMRITSGAKWYEPIIMLLLAIVAVGALAYTKPYIRERIETLLRPGDFQGSGYQIKQSLIAIGSGGMFGRGFGQSVQKFTSLPEPIGDSIFAVTAEEVGFIGSCLLIVLYVIFALRGFMIAAKAPDKFGGLMAVGLVILIVAQSFTNIGSMLGIAPLTGVPLVFVSHGGTALFVAMAEVGILLNISRYSHGA